MKIKEITTIIRLVTEDEEEREIKRTAFDFESAEENLGKLERTVELLQKEESKILPF